MKIVTFDDIRNLNIPPLKCYELVDEMIKDKSKTQLPPKISMHFKGEVFWNIMPCALCENSQQQIGGVKIVNRYPKRNPSLDSRIILMDMKSGDFLAFMDANWITAMRTGAVALHSIKLLAKRDFKTIAVLGLGNTARATILMLAELFPNQEFTIKLLMYNQQEILFKERFKDYNNFHFVYSMNVKDAVRDSDIVISCVTFFDHDICKNEYFDEGVLVIPIHTRGFSNCDLFFDKIYADDRGHVCHFKYFDKFKYFAEVSDVINNKAIGRENSQERILAYNIGLSIHDINFASYIYQIVKDQPCLGNIEMKNPKEKFWV